MADDFSVFDMVGAPASDFVQAPVGVADTFAFVRTAFWDDLGQPEYMQIGSEWVRVTGVGTRTLTNPTASAAYDAAATVLAVNDAYAFRANASLGVTDQASLSTAETLLITDVIDATTIRVVRGHNGTTPASIALGAVLQLAENPRVVINLQRGQINTQAATHQRYSLAHVLYRPADFVKPRALNTRYFFARVRYVGGTVAVVGTLTGPVGSFEIGAGRIAATFATALPAGAIFQVTSPISTPATNYLDIYVTRIADGAGTPIVPSTNFWNAFGAVATTADQPPALTGSDLATADVRVTTAGDGIEILTAGHYVFEVTVYR